MTDHERFIRVDAVRPDLRRHSARSGVAMVCARGAQLALQLGGAMALGRLLTPADFGVQAMVLPLAILVNNITNLGLQTAIIHREQLDHLETSAMFWASLRINVVVTALMALAAPGLARVYADPRVTRVTLVWAAIIFGATLSALHEALLKRQMRFGTLVLVQLGTLLVSILAAIVAALLGAAYWALMIQVGVAELTRVAVMWVVYPWRPARAAVGGLVGASAIRELRAYWANLSGARVVSWLGDQCDRVMVGARGGAPILGLYYNAKRWAWFPFLELYLSLSDVAVASLSRVQRDAGQYRLYVIHAFLPLLMVALPAIAFIFVDAPAVLHVLLGPQWIGASTFVRLMCVAAVGGSVSRLMQWIYLSTGQTSRQLRWTMVSTPVMVAAVVMGAWGGAVGVATAFAVANCALALPGAVYALRQSHVTVSEFGRVFARPLVAAVAAGGVLAVAAPYLPGSRSSVVELIVGIPVFAVAYGLSWLAQPGGARVLRELFAGVSDLRAARSSAVVPAHGTTVHSTA